MNKITRALSVAVAALAFTMTSAATSHADGSQDGTAYARPVGGDFPAKAHFKAYGEIFTIYDLKKDGRSGIGVLSYGSAASTYYYWNHSGAGTTLTKNLDIAEGRPLVIWSCTGNYQGTPTGGLDWTSGCNPNTDVGTAVWA
ncbi:hypothetical protein ACGFR6_09410 [Streptomyces sp. NPDC048567]|uniref:hypothetical protein n=1 Tax=unclassified Streptomyces TaxID=2593676 RepID=UPI0003710D90|nr:MULTISPECIES: hypothetical protein [unclassified Streptomyces]MYQ80386.1 hypothetical protein [Streptomyces sp. SID4923]NEC09288.1 hypothetical protein [Streptomyces sp. SID7909]OKI94847.1 hypothetical protein AMK18_28665 [Streptomyces sp. CB01249]WUC98969.1 hypothetical protein OHS17_04615 [Streptomyces sp. NBC_00523]